VLAALLFAVVPGAAAAPLIQTNLVSNIPGLAIHTDANLRNPWGIAESGSSPFWISDNHTGLSTLYNTTGVPLPRVVTIPPAPGAPAGTLGSPTGIIRNDNAGAFGGASFVFATEDGVIAAWSGGTTATVAADLSPSGAVYKGLAGGTTSEGDFLYGTDFTNGTIDVFDASFAPASRRPAFFDDPNVPKGFAPFGIRNIDGALYVTYARQKPGTIDDDPGLGNGFVDVFDTNGHLQQRLISRGPLDSPWGLAIAPAGFGQFAGDLLVGNFGNGLINAFDPGTGAFLGTLRDRTGKPIQNDGLWALQFGNGGNGGRPDVLYNTAGQNDEEDGLFAAIHVPEPATLPLIVLAIAALARARRRAR
jgi:uncharacterized protein (TIGR03118 family)